MKDKKKRKEPTASRTWKESLGNGIPKSIIPQF